MNFVESVQDLFSLVSLDDGEETAVETTTVPLPMWRPPGGDLVPAPQRQVEKMVERAIRKPDGTLVFERETIYLRYSDPEPTPDPQPEPYKVFTFWGPPRYSIAEQRQMQADVQAGRAVFIGGPGSIEEAIEMQLRHGQVRVSNGRIVLE